MYSTFRSERRIERTRNMDSLFPPTPTHSSLEFHAGVDTGLFGIPSKSSKSPRKAKSTTTLTWKPRFREDSPVSVSRL